MRYKQLTQLTGVILALFLLALVAGPASGATFNLCTGVVTKSIDPDGAGPLLPVDITMWGFGNEDSTATCESASVPGPNLEADGTGLTINLRNTLTEPVSLHILGQMFDTAPIPTFSGGRVMSFTHEAAQSGGTAQYVWSNFRVGTYMLQSGTNPAKQVQMGLYAAVKKDAAPGVAYPDNLATVGVDESVPYDKEQIVVFSEIDPEIHAAIAAEMYGPAPTDPPPDGWITSSAFRHPRYFLINGEVFESGGALDPINAVPIDSSSGERVLLRFVNAGLETHVPQILGLYMTTVAEDGNPYNHPKEEYGFELAAAKTKDAIIQPAAEGPVPDTAGGKFPLYDAKLNMTNMGQSPGGMLAYLLVSSSAVAPVANPDGYNVAEGGILNEPTPGVLGNDTAAGGGALPAGSTAILVSDVIHGTLTLNADGSFIYTHDGTETISDTFTYKVNDGTFDSNVATVTITVNPVNDGPVAVDDTAETIVDTPVDIDVLANDSDPEGDTLVIQSWTQGSNGGSVIAILGPQLQYTPPTTVPPDPPFTGTDTFTYTINDGSTLTSTATVTVTVNPAPANQRPVAVDDNATVVRNSSGNLINVVANDFDPDGTIDTTSVVIIDLPDNGTIVGLPSGAGVVTYTPNAKFKGADSFSYRVSDNEGGLSQRDTPTGLSDEPTVVFINVVIKLP